MSFDLLGLPESAIGKIGDKLSAQSPRSRVMLANTCKAMKHELWDAYMFFLAIQQSKPKAQERSVNGRAEQVISARVFEKCYSEVYVECAFQYSVPPSTSRRMATNGSGSRRIWKLSRINMWFGKEHAKTHALPPHSTFVVNNNGGQEKDEYVQPILSWLHKMLFFNKKVRRLFAFGSSSFEWPSDNYDVELQDFVQVV